MDRLEQILADLKALTSERGKLQFLAEHTGLPSETVARIYNLGEPWPAGPKHYSEWLEEYEDVREGLLAIGPVVALDQEDEMAKLKRGEEIEIPRELVEQLERVQSLSGEDLDTITAVYKALFAYKERLDDLLAAYTSERMKRE